MKKTIATLTLTALAVMTIGPALTNATPIETSLTKDVSGGAAPIVKAKWEANGHSTNVLDYYTDDATTAGAQFLPSGQYQVDKKIALCAVVTDPDGLADIDSVFADVFYPNVALGSSHTPLADQSGDGCEALMQEDKMTRLSKNDGIELFCQKVKSNNNNLPTFNYLPGDSVKYTYDEICATDGELMKETAAVYCATKELSYEDPSGDYEVWAVAQDKTGQHGILENYFTYLSTTAFETDFNSVSYGNVRLNTKKIISGDLNWNPSTDTKPTVRNVGNTRLAMKVWQDDMGLGKTSGTWNVEYDGRLGSDVAFKDYWPETTTTLNGELDLSEKDEMDFSIIISKFPPTGEDNFIGTMTLSAMSIDHLNGCD